MYSEPQLLCLLFLTHIFLETSRENLLYICKIRIEEKEPEGMQSRCAVWLCLKATKLLKREILGSKGSVDGVYSLLGCNAKENVTVDYSWIVLYLQAQISLKYCYLDFDIQGIVLQTRILISMSDFPLLIPQYWMMPFAVNTVVWLI